MPISTRYGVPTRSLRRGGLPAPSLAGSAAVAAPGSGPWRPAGCVLAVATPPQLPPKGEHQRAASLGGVNGPRSSCGTRAPAPGAIQRRQSPHVVPVRSCRENASAAPGSTASARCARRNVGLRRRPSSTGNTGRPVSRSSTNIRPLWSADRDRDAPALVRDRHQQRAARQVVVEQVVSRRLVRPDRQAGARRKRHRGVGQRQFVRAVRAVEVGRRAGGRHEHQAALRIDAQRRPDVGGGAGMAGVFRYRVEAQRNSPLRTSKPRTKPSLASVIESRAAAVFSCRSPITAGGEVAERRVAAAEGVEIGDA